MSVSEILDSAPPPLPSFDSISKEVVEDKSDATLADRFGSVSIVESMQPTRTSMVGALSSAAVHMILLIGLGVMFATVQHQGALDIEMSVANTSAHETIETFSVETEELTELPTETPVSAVTAPPEMAFKEPELVLEMADLATGLELADPMAVLSDSVDKPGDSGAKSDSNKKGSFFGADAYGDEFVYVVDRSTSMGQESQYGMTRFHVACRELLRSISQLEENQKFCVFMFSYRTRVMFDQSPRMIRATKVNKQRIAMWINNMGLGGGTDPRYGTMMALQLKPDAIFLLSDGEFNGQEVNSHGIPRNPTIEQIIVRMRKDSVPIHTIAFEDMRNRRRLRRIASETNGTHRFVGSVSGEMLIINDLSSNNMSDVAYAMQCLIDETHRLHSDEAIFRAANLILGAFQSKNAKLRQRAYHAMLALAGGEDLGPGDDDPTKEDFETARIAWADFWREHFRGRRTNRL